MIAALAWLAAINIATFATFGFDKAAAQRGARRVPEKTLLGMALLGGWPGAKLGQRRFRHKTRKQPFATLLNAAPIVTIGAVVLWVYQGLPALT